MIREIYPGPDQCGSVSLNNDKPSSRIINGRLKKINNLFCATSMINLFLKTPVKAITIKK